MLLKRLEVTIQSFAWEEDVAPAAPVAASSDDSAMRTDTDSVSETAERHQRLAARFAALRAPLQETATLPLDRLRSARGDLVASANASVANAKRASTVVRDMQLGSVPDRGGRVTAAAKAANTAASMAGTATGSPRPTGPASRGFRGGGRGHGGSGGGGGSPRGGSSASRGGHRDAQPGKRPKTNL